MSELLTAALSYHKQGFSVIPLQAREKKPLIAWEEYQSRRAGEEEIRAWWSKWPDANVGVVTGAVSGLVVIDLDSVEAKDKVKELLADYNLSCVPRSRKARAGNYFSNILESLSRIVRVFAPVWMFAAMVAMWSRRCRVIRTPKPSGAKPGLGLSIRSFNGAWVNEGIGISSPRGGNCDHADLLQGSSRADRILLCWAAVDFSAAGNLVDDYPMDRFVVTNPDDAIPVRSSEAGQGRRHLSAEKGGWMREHGQFADSWRTGGS